MYVLPQPEARTLHPEGWVIKFLPLGNNGGNREHRGKKSVFASLKKKNQKEVG